MSVIGFDQLFNSDETNSICDLDSRDAVLASVSHVHSWIYDPKSRTMIYEMASDESSEDSLYRVKEYNKSIKDMKLIVFEDEPVFDVFCAELDAFKDNINIEYQLIGRGYNTFWVRQIGHTVMGEDGKPAFIVGRSFDITAEKNKTAQSQKNAGQDGLTGLYNKEKAQRLIEKELSSSDKQNALILIDVDEFRVINESFGKTYGDTVLQTISGVIYTNFMNKDVIARVAGDQFMIFCGDISEEKVKSLISELSERLILNVPVRKDIKIKISAGVAFSPKDSNEFYSLYNYADIALFKAKNSDDTCVIFDKEMLLENISGATYRKIGTFNEDAERINKSEAKANKKLFDYAFEVLSKKNNLADAMVNIFSELGLHYGTDRTVLMEYNYDLQMLSPAVKWSRYSSDHDYAEAERTPLMKFESFDVAAGEDGYVIFENGRAKTIDFFREMLVLEHKTVSSVHYAIRYNDRLMAVVIVEAENHHDFSKQELVTYRTILNLMSSYRVSQIITDELEAETVVNQNVMDAQKIIYYVADKETHELKYISKYAKHLFPNAEYGRKCFQTIYGRECHCEVCPMHDGVGDTNMVEVYDETEKRWFTMTATAMQNTVNANDTLVCVTDVTEFLKRVKSEDSLTVASSYDSFVVEATRLFKRKKDDYTVVCTGIDKFSKINDEYGYVVGDEILKRFAELIKENISEEHLMCRIKGDDFAVITTSSLEEIREHVIKYSRILTEEFRKEHAGIDIAVYAGAYRIDDTDEYINHCIDNALKARKVAGEERNENGGFYEYTHELEIKANEEAKMMKMMKESLKSGGFKVFLQPKVNIDDGRIRGAEALVRLQGEDGKMISPGFFIPLAEKNGMIADIDVSVYESTLSYIARWKAEGKNVPVISVNVSRVHLLNDGFPEFMKTLVEKYGLTTDDIELEITESVFFEDTERLIRMIQRLKDIGFAISMDDFGSGYSTLNFMKTMPVDVIKIDGGFFMKNEMDKKSQAIISAIIRLTKDLEYRTVSEGVETKEQVEFLKANGGGLVQGYYYYKPMPAEEFEKLI